MTSREQFEAWLSNTYEWANDTLDMAFFYGDDETGYYTGGDFIYDGRSCSDALFWAWRGWQASREAVEVEIDNHTEFEIEHMICPDKDGYSVGWIDGRNYAVKQVRAAGIKVKGE
ncbi:hypothetical protein [Hafnia paralvei]|jgi:hypothetical protein|uniref:hypothetical protein n=1 Tax=Hafnia paralvei TaxID=546367 RepID=UPI0021088039|nr:hypothetical protein [Hafnia paralvei]MCQ4169729.1 hypothetical protein [Hafnia paralvei]